MRLAWYAGASTALAAGVVASAFHQRANFYSAMVHLAQSSLSLMILVNLVFLMYGSFMYGLQRLCFGQLRPVEIEQLYEKAWFAVTETCLAMTIFREEVGAFFLVMFTALVTGKVWGWIGEGRVEVLEQQPPVNPRLFHTRLSISLLLSFFYDCWLLWYAVDTVVQQARPTMMVMFLFEFAVLTVTSFHTGFRYIMSLWEARVIKQQTAQRLEDRRRQVREQRAEILRRRETEGVTETESEAAEPLPSEDDIDEMDIEVPGWESKGQWVLGLDLLADMIKMGIYVAFFCVLFTFYGLPIHIMRDVFMTTRSFVKRLHALLRYRQALRDMNKYPDATAEDLGREDTCIICREEMHPWDPANPGQVERSRPKKLPCGHILHFGCLKSWLERQQVCPTCRRSVVMDAPPPARNGDAMVFRLGFNFPLAGDNQAGQGDRAAAGGGQDAPAAQGRGQQNGEQNRRNGGVRMFNLGPIRLGFAQGGAADIQDMAQQMGLPANVAGTPAANPQPAGQDQDAGENTLDDIRVQLADVNQRVLEAGQRVQQDVQNLQNAEAQLYTLNLLLQEMQRLNQVRQYSQRQQQIRERQQQGALQNGVQPALAPGSQPETQPATQPQAQPQQQAQPLPAPFPHPIFQPQHTQFHPMRQANHFVPPTATRHGGAALSTATPAGSPELPEGVVIPPGWSLLPLQRVDRMPLQPGAQRDGSVPRATSTAAGRSEREAYWEAPTTTASTSENAFGPRPAPSMAGPFAPPGGVSASSFQTPPVQNTNDQPVNGGAAAGSAAAQEQRAAGDAETTSSVNEARESQSTAAPTVTTPTPIMPNWGGAAQLFGGAGAGGAPAGGSNGSANLPYGMQQSVASTSAQQTEQNDDGQNTAAASTDKGKGRGVTVESDDSDDDA